MEILHLVDEPRRVRVSQTPPVEHVDVFGVLDVDERQPESLREAEPRQMARADQLAARFHVLAGYEVAQRQHAAAHPIAALDDRHVIAAGFHLVSGGEAREARADDDDAPAPGESRRPSEAIANQHPGGRRQRQLQQLAARQPVKPCSRRHVSLSGGRRK